MHGPIGVPDIGHPSTTAQAAEAGTPAIGAAANGDRHERATEQGYRQRVRGRKKTQPYACRARLTAAGRVQQRTEETEESPGKGLMGDSSQADARREAGSDTQPEEPKSDSQPLRQDQKDDATDAGRPQAAKDATATQAQ